MRLKPFSFLTMVGLLLLMACSNASRSDLPADSFYLGGIQINEPNYDEWVNALQTAGMNTVSITAYARQGLWNTEQLWRRPHEPGVVKEIEAAKAADLHVVFIPRLVLDHYFAENKFLWHGMTMPQTDEMVKKWFAWYTDFLVHWAKICEANQVEVFAIGSELRALSRCMPIDQIPPLEDYYLDPAKQQRYLQSHLQFKDEIAIKQLWVRGADNYDSLEVYLQDEIKANAEWAKEVAFQEDPDPLRQINQRRALLLQEWTRLIKVVRCHYSGQLTYAANFDNYQNVAFWDQLDLMGINAYFKLRTLEEAVFYPQLKNSWDTIFHQIYEFQNQHQFEQAVLFTELGYINRANCTIMPWEGSGFTVIDNGLKNTLMVWSEQKPDLQERSLAIHALYEATRQSQLHLQGILYWKLTTKGYHLPYEPFALHLKSQEVDSLQIELARFVE